MASLMSAYGRLPVNMQRGKGAQVWDDQDREYLDAISGIAVCSLGHADPVIAEAIAEQAQKLLHVSNLYQIPEQEQLGESLCQIAGMDKAFFCNSGAEANEACIKIARLHGHQRNIDAPKIIVANTAFHGRTLATLSATGNTKIQDGFGPLVSGFLSVPFNDVAAIKSLAQNHNDIVAVLVEPVQGEGGINVPDDDYLSALRQLCDANNWLLMLDEIQSGMGRTGAWFAHQHTAIQPDVMSVAKALGNGMPIGACLARGPAAELIQPGSHGTTFGGNPLACRVGLTVINEMRRRQLPQRAAELGERIHTGFKHALHNQPGVVDIRGKGLMIGIELAMPCGDLVQRALQAGLMINVAAGNVVRLLPPLILTDTQADDMVQRVSQLIIDYLADTDTAEGEHSSNAGATNNQAANV